MYRTSVNMSDVTVPTFKPLSKKITQWFCINSTRLLWESLRKQISIVWKFEATEATQACKQRLWLPLWLSVSLTALLIHLRHKRQQTRRTRSYQFIIKNILFHVFPCYYKILTFEVKTSEIAWFQCADIKGKKHPWVIRTWLWSV